MSFENKNTTNTFVEQVGGEHYQAEYQHWDMCEEYDVDGLAWNATKYVSRYDRKGKPREDLLKAKSYLDKMMATRKEVRRRVPIEAVDRFCQSAKQGALQRKIHLLILNSGSTLDILFAQVLIQGLIDECGE